MKKPFITRSFTKISEAKLTRAQAASSAKQTLNHVKDVFESIRIHNGEDEANNVLNIKEMEHLDF